MWHSASPLSGQNQFYFQNSQGKSIFNTADEIQKYNNLDNKTLYNITRSSKPDFIPQIDEMIPGNAGH